MENYLDNSDRTVIKKKILLLGQPETGKSSMKKVIFEGVDPIELIVNPLTPTRGIDPSVHSWFDLKIGLFDTSGQELFTLFTDTGEQHFAFQNCDVIIYIYDYNQWISNKNKIFEDIRVIDSIIKKLEINTKLIIFCHKIDLIEASERNNKFNEMKKQIDFPIFFTSIEYDLLYSLYEAFYSILSNFSKENSRIKRLLDEKLKDFPKSMFFITNEHNNIIIQTTSRDFNFTDINYMHYLTALLNLTLEKMRDNDKIDHLILQTQKNYTIIMKNLELIEYDLKNIICISETLNSNKLIWLIGEISVQLNSFYKL